MERRSFVKYTAAAGASLMLHPFSSLAAASGKKIRLAQVGTGHRGTGFWGADLIKNFGEHIEFVGLYDSNPGRKLRAQKLYGGSVPVFESFDEMISKVTADYIIVTTVDATHNEFIVKALDKGFNVITEKPMTTDEVKCKEILDAEKRSGKKVIVAFNYRHSVHNMQLKELLAAERVGKITSVDFHWYLNVYHGADYFRRWHGRMNKSGSLWVHKATHHFDLLNWWVNSEPVEVTAYGSLEHYGKNNSFRGTKCRGCEFKDKCKFYWDMTKDARLMSLYAENEKYDGYLRDGCVWSNEIDIYDKMSAQIIYANGITANYSLTTYSPYEGWKIAFNGMKGRIDTWEDIPFLQKVQEDQSKKHAVENDLGDCIDCFQCVKVCPTGIDIRNGVQLECVGCTACIDAWNNIMDRIGKPHGLIRYASEATIAEGTPLRYTSRMKLYTALCGLVLLVLSFIWYTRTDVDATIMRTPGHLYQERGADTI